jgi:hypothetical protein
MSQPIRFLTIGMLLAVITPLASAQNPSILLGFNSSPIDDEFDSQEMFRIPEFTQESQRYIQPNDSGLLNLNSAFRAAGLQSDGAAAMQVSLRWKDPSDPNAWVRLSTFNGPLVPNPSLHTQGTVTFDISNRSELFFGEFGLCLGIRETGFDVPQLTDGGTSGAIEWVGVDETINGITAGDDGIVDTMATGDDVQVVPFGTDLSLENPPLPFGTAVIEPGTNGQIDTVPSNDDQLRFGYFIDSYGERRPIPAATIPTTAQPIEVSFNLANGDVTVNGNLFEGGITGYTGNGVLDPNNNRGTLEHFAITNVDTDLATLIEFGLDELQTNAPVVDPVPAPIVANPIINGDGSVTVSGLNAVDVTAVQVYVNGSPQPAFSTGLPPTDPDFPTLAVTVPLQSNAVTGQSITATQTAHGVTSAQSNPVIVSASPPPYTFSIMIDERGEGSCDSATAVWEFLGATSTSGSFLPFGTQLIPNDAEWQLIDISLTNDSLIQPSLGGNGTLAPSAVGFYTFDSFWFTISPAIDPNRLGPYEVLIDGIEYLDPNGAIIDVVLNAERTDGLTELGGDRGQRTQPTSTPADSQVSTGSYDGDNANIIQWSYDSTASNLAVAVLQRIGEPFQCGTDFTYAIPDNTATMRLRMLLRDIPTQPTLPLPEVLAPVVGAQSSVQVSVDPSATSVQLVINGAPVGAPIDPNGATVVQFDSLPTLTGDSVSATQTLALGVSDLAYPRAAAEPLPPVIVSPILVNSTLVEIGGLMTDPFATTSEVRLFADDLLIGTAVGGTSSVTIATAVLAADTVLTATQVVNGAESLLSDPVVVGTPPEAPTVNPPLQAGEVSVNLSDINPAADLVTVYAAPSSDPNARVAIGSIDPNGLTEIDVPVSSLVNLDLISATASNISGESDFSISEEVGKGNGVSSITLLIRETGTTVGLGEDGGFSNGIEFVGSPVSASGAPQGKPISPSPTWQTFIFDPAADPIRGFAGSTANGILTSPTDKGTIEAIGFSVDANSPERSLGTYTMYIDNVINIGADGGNDFLIDDFEGVTAGTVEYMFQEPGFSGSTSGNLLTNIANVSEVSAEQGNPGNSIKLSWYFRDSLVQRWVRLTTFQAPGGRPNPTIDLTKPIQMDVLLLEQLPPSPPTVVGPLVAGDNTVTITDILPDAVLVTVLADGATIGSVDPNGADTIEVDVNPLIHLNSITAKQTATGGESGQSTGIEVGRGNGHLLVSIGIRETGDLGPLGSQGTTGGQIEWIGASAAVNGAPQGKPVAFSNSWQTITFDPNIDPILGFTGDDEITETRGTLEHLAVAVDANDPLRSTGIYRVYIDNVINVGADGGNDFVIQNFDDPNIQFTEALFRNPGLSGSTDGDSIAAPDFSSVRAAFGNPNQSLLLSWFFIDTSAQRWQRVVTSQTATTPSPIIDLTRPIQLDILLLEPCVRAGDMNRDGLLNATDVDPFLQAVAGPQNPIDPSDLCGDFSGNDYIDMLDVTLMQRDFGS